MTDKKKTGLDLLREPFPLHQISKLPKPTKKQTELVKQDYKNGVRCKVCGQWHHPDVVHLDYVGHAALTDRLLDCDPAWDWQPMAFDQHGAPLLDANKGLWIKLTVCGQTRIGYGHPDNKAGGDAIKETIGDALRNAAMRFGAALDLWHKGDLHGPVEGDVIEAQEAQKQTPSPSPERNPQRGQMDDVKFAIDSFTAKNDMAGLDAYMEDAGIKAWVESFKADNAKGYARLQAYLKQQREKIMATDDCPIPVQAAE